ncbi:MAG: formyltransferase family protein [Candidatus Bathyarchaeota archaeon]|nr:formyltransferase family protein [Candidatus Bathyarchaeota archaeon]
MRLNYVFMVLKEHPYGREMLRQLLAAGFVPKAIIEEGSPVADEEREKFLTRIKGFPVAPTFTEQIKGLGIERYSVPHHNKKESRELLEKLKPDLIVLGGTRIIKPALIVIPMDGMLNSHPGLLPEVRGSASVAWSVYFDIPIGCTVHFIDPNIDTGDIVKRQVIRVHRGDMYEKLCWETIGLAGELMVYAVGQWTKGTLKGTPQPAGQEALRVAPPDVLDIVYKKLRDGTYKHFVD